MNPWPPRSAPRSRKGVRATATVALLTLFTVLGARLLNPGDSEVRKPDTVHWVSWPSHYDFGQGFQGSEVEFRLAVFTTLKAVRPPAWLKYLPSRNLRDHVREDFENRAARRALAQWQMDISVDAPPFVRIDRVNLAHHTHFGVYADIRGHLDTANTGTFRGDLQIRAHRGEAVGEPTLVPLRAELLPAPSAPARKVLVASTPYDGGLNGQGSGFDKRGSFRRELARRDVWLDYREQVPHEDLTNYAVVLITGRALREIHPEQVLTLQQWVRSGGRLVIVGHARDGTVAGANDLAGPFGLVVRNQEIIANSGVPVRPADPLTADIDTYYPGLCSPVEILRPGGLTRLLIWDAVQGIGVAGISRGAGRGDVCVITSADWQALVDLDLPPEAPGNGHLMIKLLTP